MNKKHIQLGIPSGTASNRLKKLIMFNLLKQLNKNFCHQCGSEIESEDQLSIEHKVPWLDSENPVKNFFDLQNIAFSHHSCNCSAARRPNHGHPSFRAYNAGCRCEKCTELQREKKQKYRQKLKMKLITTLNIDQT